jgi:hypothetical protein
MKQPQPDTDDVKSSYDFADPEDPARTPRLTGTPVERFATASGPVTKKLLQASRAAGATMLEANATQRRGKKSIKQLQSKTWNVLAERAPRSVLPRELDVRPYVFVQDVDFGNAFVTNATGFATYAQMYTLSQVPQQATFTALYDQYRISLIEVWLTPEVQGVQSNSALLLSVIDYDDANTPTNEAYLENYQNMIMTNIQEGHYRVFVPHVAIASYSGTFTSFANMEAPWIDSASNTVAHYGIKAGTTMTNAVIAIGSRVRFTIEFRNVR